MPIVLDHTIVPARDKVAAARFFASILGLAAGDPVGPFVPVQVNAELTLDFDDRHAFEPHHYAFLVDEATFDAALRRLRESGARFGSGPAAGWDQKIDQSLGRSDGGRRVYFTDDNGHSYELFTNA